jgi:hypothetical protein
MDCFFLGGGIERTITIHRRIVRAVKHDDPAKAGSSEVPLRLGSLAECDEVRAL